MIGNAKGGFIVAKEHWRYHPYPPLPEGVKKLLFTRLPGENRGPVPPAEGLTT